MVAGMPRILVLPVRLEPAATAAMGEPNPSFILEGNVGPESEEGEENTPEKEHEAEQAHGVHRICWRTS